VPAARIDIPRLLRIGKLIGCSFALALARIPADLIKHFRHDNRTIRLTENRLQSRENRDVRWTVRSFYGDAAGSMAIVD